MPETLTIEDYDTILDALDIEDTNTIIKYFQKFDLEPNSELIDAPRYGNQDIEVNTYLDYVLSYNLKNVIDIFIDELNLEITDEIITHCLELQNLDTYNYLCDLGYNPEEKTLKYVVQTCNSFIVDSILDKEKELIEYIDEDDIEYLYDIYEDISEDTVETIRVLLNYEVDLSLFKSMMKILKEKNNNYPDYENKYIVNEIIDLLESYGVKM